LNEETIHQAVAQGLLAEVMRLVEQDPQCVNATDRLSALSLWAPLHVATAYRKPEVAAYLIDHGADINGKTLKLGVNPIQDWTPLHWVAGNEGVDMVNLLLARGADSTLVNAIGVTSLMMACLNGSAECVKRFLAHPQARATINYRLENRRANAIAFAVRVGSEEIIKTLLDAGADLMMRGIIAR